MLKSTPDYQRIVPIGLMVSAVTIGLYLITTVIGFAAAQPLPESSNLEAVSVLPYADEVTSRHFPNCRFGVGGSVAGYDITSLNAGWHMDWAAQAAPVQPNTTNYIQMVRLKSDLDGLSFVPATTTLQSILSLNPGAIWLVGNEPDSPWQDNLLPAEYAYLYHQVYQLIKQSDPSAQVGIGGIVQATPLRFQYLDDFLITYRQMYGELPPADLWNIHSYILREITADDPEAAPNGPYEVWGAYIPRGLTATRGLLYTYSQMFSQTIFRQRLIDFRVWMAKWGYRDKPLYITEFGTLFPYPPYVDDPWIDEYGMPLTEARTAAFMTGTFNLLRDLSDSSMGYPPDANRLVQRWLWYSVSDSNFGGPLFDQTSKMRRPLGDVFADYTQAISPSIDLFAIRVMADPAVVANTGASQTTTLRATISNIGNVAITQPITVGFYAGWAPTGTLIGALQVFTSGLEGCARTAELSVTWPNLGVGAHPMYIRIDPGQILSESTRENNVTAGIFLVAKYHVYLPTIAKN